MNPILEEDLKTVARDIAPLAKKLSGKTALITGGAGFLGNYFIGVIDQLNKSFMARMFPKRYLTSERLRAASLTK